MQALNRGGVKVVPASLPGCEFGQPRPPSGRLDEPDEARAGSLDSGFQICGADAGEMDLDPDLRLRRLRHRDLFPLEKVGGTIIS